ncbi:MAG: serine hydrolase domain-containing protein [Nitrosopumilus sp.]
MNKEGSKLRISDTLKETIQEKVDAGKHESLFVGIMDKDDADYYCYGKTAKDGNPIDENTIFEIGSISKVFTSLILADMVVNGEIHLDDPIDKFLPESVRVPSRNGKKITLLNLSTHTSGLPRMHSLLPDPKPDKTYEYTKDGMYDFLSDYELTRDIGLQFEYSNTGGSLLSHVLSLHAGKSYEQTLKERILDRLGLDSTCVNECDELRDRFAKPHHLGKIVDELNLPDEMAGSGGIKSSGKDMLAFLSYAMSLEDSELQQAFELSQITNHRIDEIQSIGLGWVIINNGKRNVVWHNGATDGFASFIGFDSDSKEGVVVLTNSQEIVDRIGLEILGFDVEELKRSVKNEKKSNDKL